MSLCDYVCVVVEGIYTCNTRSFSRNLCVYVCVVVEGMYTCETGSFGKRAFVFMFVMLYSICTHFRLGIMATIFSVYVCVVV